MKNPDHLNVKILPKTHDGKDDGFVGIFNGDELVGRCLTSELLRIAGSLRKGQTNDAIEQTSKAKLSEELADAVGDLMMSEGLDFTEATRLATQRNPKLWADHVEKVNR